MANNCCESSSFMNLDADQIERAQEIVDAAIAEMRRAEDEDNADPLGVVVEVRDDGVWFHYEESFNPDHAEMIARALVNGLEIDEPFYCSWAYTCSKPRIDEFGGGAFVLKRGYETYWCDAMNHVRNYYEDGAGLTPEGEDDEEA